MHTKPRANARVLSEMPDRLLVMPTPNNFLGLMYEHGALRFTRKVTPRFRWGNFSFSGALGYQAFATGTRPDFLTWNAGLFYMGNKSLKFDLRYWDTDLSNSECAITNINGNACEARVVASVSFLTQASALRPLHEGE